MKKLDKYHWEREWLRRNGIHSRVPFGFLRYVYWRDRISAILIFILISAITLSLSQLLSGGSFMSVIGSTNKHATSVLAVGAWARIQVRLAAQEDRGDTSATFQEPASCVPKLPAEPEITRDNRRSQSAPPRPALEE
jgi:hypothetical protein